MTTPIPPIARLSAALAPHLEEDSFQAMVRVPMQALESSAAKSFGTVFASALRWLWLTLFPSWLRKSIRKRLEAAISSRSQARFRLNPRGSNKFFRTDAVDHDIVTIDGVTLKTTHYWPRDYDHEQGDAGGGPLPVVVLRTPYFRKFDLPIARIFCERGYHVICQDARGHFESGGSLGLGELEARDAGCTMRYLSEQEWCDGRIILIGISIGGYTTYASAAGILKEHHRAPVASGVAGEDVDLRHVPKPRKPIQIVAVIPLFSSSEIVRAGSYVQLEENMQDPVMRLDLSTKYSDFMWRLAKRKEVFGSHALWVAATIFAWQLKGKLSTSWGARQMHLPLSELDIACCGEVPQPRLPIVTSPTDPFWEPINYEWVPGRLGEGLGVGDDEAAPPPALFMASGWFDIFREETIRDYHRAINAAEKAKREGKPYNEHIYLLMCPATHFSLEFFFGKCMGETIRILDHTFEDLGREKHHSEPLINSARVTVFCFGSGGFFFHRLSPINKMTILSDPHHPFNIENDSHHAWRYYDCWPPATAKSVTFALQPRGRLVPRGVKEFEKHLANGSDAFLWDPENPTPTVGGAQFDAFNSGPLDNRKLEIRHDTIVYTTPENKSQYPIEIAGVMKCRVWVFSTAMSADIYSRITLVDPITRESVSLCDGIHRITLKPGESWPKLFEIDMGNFCFSVEHRWRVRLMLGGGSFPQFSRNLGYGEHIATAIKMTKAKHRVSFCENGEYSVLDLPVLGGEECARAWWEDDLA